MASIDSHPGITSGRVPTSRLNVRAYVDVPVDREPLLYGRGSATSMGFHLRRMIVTTVASASASLATCGSKAFALPMNLVAPEMLP